MFSPHGCDGWLDLSQFEVQVDKVALVSIKLYMLTIRLCLHMEA